MVIGKCKYHKLKILVHKCFLNKKGILSKHDVVWLLSNKSESVLHMPIGHLSKWQALQVITGQPF